MIKVLTIFILYHYATIGRNHSIYKCGFADGGRNPVGAIVISKIYFVASYIYALIARVGNF
jgi:hypothetical protein